MVVAVEATPTAEDVVDVMEAEMVAAVTQTHAVEIIVTSADVEDTL